jgi:cephalosporin-C deacetylase-like acetyl esterase
MVVDTVISYRRGMDYLATRADIDTSRIGLIEGSFGAHVGFLLTAMDHRVKAAGARRGTFEPHRRLCLVS